MGLGDWFNESYFQRRSEFQASHLIHRKLGRDIISIGRSGIGSMDAALMAVRAYSFVSTSVLFRVEQPKTILFYFYEGNDLSDNLRKDYFLDTKYPLSERISKFRDSKSHIDKKAPIYCTFFLGSCFAWHLIQSETTSYINRFKNIRIPGNTNRIKVNGQHIWIPDNLQGSFVQLLPIEKSYSFLVFEEALKILKKNFPNSLPYVIYIPSVLTSYKIVSPTVSIEDELKTNDMIFKTSDLLDQSQETKTQIRLISERNLFQFIDTTNEINEAAENTLIHGPKDWKHFNKLGYEALTKAILLGL